MHPEQIFASHKGVCRYRIRKNYRLPLWLATERGPDSSAGCFTVDWKKARAEVWLLAGLIGPPHLPFYDVEVSQNPYSAVHARYLL
jgi:hypothetical protein